MPNAPKILVIGGGISGLACAWRLRQLGLPVLLLERGSRFGGVIETVEENGFRFDIGPQSFTNTPALSELIDEARASAANSFAPILALRDTSCTAGGWCPRLSVRRGF